MFTKGFLYQKRQLGRRFKESQQKRFEKCLENDLEGIGMGGCNKQMGVGADEDARIAFFCDNGTGLN